MLDFDLGDLDLGSRRKSTEWVSFAPVPAPRKKRGAAQVITAVPLSVINPTFTEVSPRAKPKVPRERQTCADGSGPSSEYPSQDWPTPRADCLDAHQEGERQSHPQVETGGEALSDRKLRINATLWNSESRSTAVEWLPPEREEGNTEYKLRLRNPPPCRFEQLVTQLQYRLSEGGGLAYYYIGVEDNGYPRGLDPPTLDQSLATMMRMADALDAAATVDRILHAPRGRLAVRLTVCKLATDEARYEDTRVVVLGGTGSGKSTLVSVLCHGADGRPLLDNGRGRARTAVFRHKHEVETGRTSALSQDSVGYDSEGCVINYAGVSTMTQAEVSASARKLVTLIDVGGHKRFIKTALNGLTAMTPDYAMLCIPCQPSDPARIASDPLSDIMIEHLTAAIGLGIPLILVITKADLGQEAVSAVHERLMSLFTSSQQGRGVDAAGCPFPQLVSCASQAQHIAEGMLQRRPDRQRPLLPVFEVSSVSGAGLPLLHAFLSALRQSSHSSLAESTTALEDQQPAAEHEAHFQVGYMFEVENVGSVASGTLLHGSVSVGDHLWLGPGKRRSLFTHCQVTSIHRSQLPVRCITAGQTATVALHPANIPMPPSASNPPDAWQVPDCSASSPFDSVLQQASSSVDASGGSLTSFDAFVQGKPSLDVSPSKGNSPLLVTSRAGSLCGSDSHLTSASDNESGRSSLLLGSLHDLSDLLSTRERCPMDRRWTQVGLIHGAGSPRSVSSRRSSSRGAVLLAYGCGPPKGALEFEAELALLPGGRWPTRGLLSGRWPPGEAAGHMDGAGLHSGRGRMALCKGRQSPPSDCSTATATSRPSRRKRKAADCRMQYTCVIHCGCASQAAHVTAMEDVREPVSSPDNSRLTAALVAAQVLRNHKQSSDGPPVQVASETGVIRVRLRFANHVEWMVPGSALVAQDRTVGLLAAVGVVTRVYGVNINSK